MSEAKEKITLTQGSGGRQMHKLIHDHLISRLSNGILEKLDDSARLSNETTGKLAMTTDSYVVSPLFFNGGDIGRLCICGTVNDLATSGAEASYLSLSFILEEGFLLSDLKKIINSIAETADEAGIKIVTGDTKVVEKGKGDGIYINTCGIGFIPDGVNLSSYNGVQGDIIAGNSSCEILLNEETIPVDKNVQAVCDLAGLDPLFLANEGKYIIVCKPESKNAVLKVFPQSSFIGEISQSLPSGRVLMETKSGGIRKIGMLETTQLPRIC